MLVQSSLWWTASSRPVGLQTSDWPSAGRGRTTCDNIQRHHIRLLQTQCRLPDHLPRLQHHWQSVIGHRDRQAEWDGSFNSRSSHGSSVDKPQDVGEDKDGGLQRLRYHPTDVWQSGMGNARYERMLNTLHLRSIRSILGIMVVASETTSIRWADTERRTTGLLTCDTRRSAWEIWRLSTSTLCLGGGVLQLTAQRGGVPWTNTARQRKRNRWLQQHEDRSASSPSDLR